MEMLKMGIPFYETVAGQKMPVGTMDHEDMQLCIYNTTVEECRAYAKSLEEAGFVQYDAREISAGSEAPYFVNLFYTYVKEDIHVFITWNAAMHTVRIIVMPAQPLPLVEKPELEECDNIVPSFTQIQLKGGLSLIAQLADASFVIIDGGNYDAEDAGRLYDFMKGRTAEGQKPVIAMWLFTHMHCDHTDLAGQFLQEYAGLVDIKAFAYQFQDCKTITILENAENSLAMSTTLVQNMKTYYPDTVVYTLHTGQTYYFKGMEMEILRTGDDMYPYPLISFNELSVACIMKFDNGKTVMILGDCSHEPCRNLACTYGDYLKSDILQLAHHGLIGGDKKLYQLIDPEICFWATNESRFKGELAGQVYQWCIGEGGLDYNTWIRDPQVRERQHYHNSVTTTINLE